MTDEPLLERREISAGMEERVMPAEFSLEWRRLKARDFQNVNLLSRRHFDPSGLNFHVLGQVNSSPAERRLEELCRPFGVTRGNC
jgi:hypothetical protein